MTRGVLVRLAVSAAVIGVLLAVTDVDAIGALLQGADWRWMAASTAGLMLLTCLMALRWVLVARGLRLDLTLARAVREYFLGTLVNQLVPGGVAGDATRAVRASERAGLRAAAQSVVIERLLGQVTTLALLSLGLAVSLAMPGGIDWPWWTVWVLAAAAIVAGGAVILLGSVSAQKMFFAPFWTALRSPEQALLALVIAILLNLSFYASARAIGTVLPFAAIFTIVLLVLSAMLIPLSVGGWGWREGAAAALFPLAGPTAAEGVATGIAYGAAMLAAAVPGAMWWATSGRHAARIQSETMETT